ncbi:MAG: hypothetical protein RLO50_23100 [Azospirillaceae bacterium]
MRGFGDPWFERRGAGRGVRPISPWGWVLVLAYLVALGSAAVLAADTPEMAVEERFLRLGVLLVTMLVVTGIFVFVVRRRTLRRK